MLRIASITVLLGVCLTLMAPAQEPSAMGVPDRSSPQAMVRSWGEQPADAAVVYATWFAPAEAALLAELNVDVAAMWPRAERVTPLAVEVRDEWAVVTASFLDAATPPGRVVAMPLRQVDGVWYLTALAMLDCLATPSDGELVAQLTTPGTPDWVAASLRTMPGQPDAALTNDEAETALMPRFVASVQAGDMTTVASLLVPSQRYLVEVCPEVFTAHFPPGKTKVDNLAWGNSHDLAHETAHVTVDDQSTPWMLVHTQAGWRLDWLASIAAGLRAAVVPE